MKPLLTRSTFVASLVMTHVAMACPIGLTPTSNLYSTSGGSGDGDSQAVDETLALPSGTQLDTSYSMPAAGFQNSGGGASSNISAGDIPKGFWISASGSTGNHARWSINKPSNGRILGAVLDEATATIDHLTFSLSLYSDNGHCGISCGGSNTKVEVCYKVK